MPVALRPALDQDFDYCRRLYFGEMEWIIEELHLDRSAQEIGFQQSWDPAQVRIIALDGADVGWLQTMAETDDLFIAQMFVDGPFQRRGIGTEVMKRLIGEAAQVNRTVPWRCENQPPGWLTNLQTAPSSMKMIASFI